MTDFFISYTSAQTKWAEWIGYVLEEEGFTVTIQAWDFRPGSNFVLEMQRASANADRTLMVLSPDYIKSQFAAPEWASAFSQDPQGLKRSLVPVVVEACQLPGLLKSIVHVDLLSLDEAAARKRLVDGIKKTRAKPSNRPAFPGSLSPRPHKTFPGTDTDVGQQSPSLPAYMPTLKRAASDIEKRRFIKDTFEMIRTTFEQTLKKLSQQESAVEYEFNMNTATDFRAEIFLNGDSKCYCRIWQGGMQSLNSIAYSETRRMEDSYNEVITLSDNREGLYLSALMSMGYSAFEQSLNMKQLNKEQAANYLWRRFVAPLER